MDWTLLVFFASKVLPNGLSYAFLITNGAAAMQGDASPNSSNLPSSVSPKDIAEDLE